MSQQPGWYDDPQETDLLRYWDGTQWTTHTSPRYRSSSGAESSAPPGGGQAQSGAGYSGTPYGDVPASSGHSAAPYGGYQPMPGADFETSGGRPRTPDGQLVSGWWRRFIARILDIIIVNILLLALVPIVAPDVFGIAQEWVELFSDPASLESPEAVALQDEIAAMVGRVSLLGAVLSIVYEAVFLKVASATPGKLALGLRVRLRDQPGPLAWNTSGVRALVWHGPSLIGIVPILGNIAQLIPLINGLWPLWDAQNQSLNDKAAKTQVVRKS